MAKSEMVLMKEECEHSDIEAVEGHLKVNQGLCSKEASCSTGIFCAGTGG